MLNWVDPIAGAILAAAVIPPLILLYFLKLRRRTQPIACTILWKKSVEDLRANAPFQRLRKSLLLLLQLIALALLALAIMQPQLRAGSRDGGRLVILIDNSASMNAVDSEEEGSTRLLEAKEKAKNLVDSLQSSGLFGGTADEVMVIGFNERAQVYANFTSSRSQLFDAIDSIEPTDASTSIDEALELARAHMVVTDPENPNPAAKGRPATLELFTDGNIADFSEQVKKGETLRYYPVGTANPDNIAFANTAAERPYDAPGTLQVFSSLLNFNDEEVVATVEMSVNGNIQAGWIKEVPIPAASTDESTGQLVPGRSNVIFGPFEQPRGAVINVRNLRPDALAVDNHAWLITPAPRNLAVAFFAPTVLLTADAVGGMPFLRRMDVKTASDFEAMLGDDSLSQYDVIILGGFMPSALPPGRYLTLGTKLPIEELTTGEVVQDFEIADWDREHPLLRYVNLDSVVVREIQPLASLDKVKVLAEAASGLQTAPVMVEYSDPQRHIVHLPFTMDVTNWIWQQSFVIFMVNAVDYLSTVGEDAAVRGLRPNEPLTARLSATATDVTITLPNGEQTAIASSDPTSITWARTPFAGIYELQWNDPDAAAGETMRRYAVNLYDEHESQIARAEELTWADQEKVTSVEEDAGLQTPLWPWALGFCLFVLMLEWWVYHRRTHV